MRDYLRPVRRGDQVAVVGCGPIGLLQVQVARLGEPARILAVEPLAHRRAAALAAGATEAVDAVAPGEGEPVFDVVFDASGSPGAVDAAVDLARPGGTVVLAGIPDEDSTTFRASVARRKGLTLHRWSGGRCPANERAYRAHRVRPHPARWPDQRTGSRSRAPPRRSRSPPTREGSR